MRRLFLWASSKDQSASKTWSLPKMNMRGMTESISFVIKKETSLM
jgi:hypothetical protein